MYYSLFYMYLSFSGLSMKTKGFSPTIVKLCDKIDEKVLAFLQDISFYLYGKEFDEESFEVTNKLRSLYMESKFADRNVLESHIRQESVLSAFR